MRNMQREAFGQDAEDSGRSLVGQEPDTWKIIESKGFSAPLHPSTWIFLRWDVVQRTAMLARSETLQPLNS